jgi:hypothetical protein
MRRHSRWPEEPQEQPLTDPRILARNLVELLENAPPLPILRGQVRIKKFEVYVRLPAARVERLTGGLRAAGA